MKSPPAFYIKTVAGFAPASAAAHDFHAKAKLGQQVVMQGRRPRNPRHHRKLFALLSILADNCEEFSSTEDALIGLKAVLGHGVWKKLHKAATREVFIPSSIAFENMGQEEFEVFYDAALAAVRRWWLPVADGELRQAIEQFSI